MTLLLFFINSSCIVLNNFFETARLTDLQGKRVCTELLESRDDWADLIFRKITAKGEM
jgi:hypothetical protein